MFLIKPLCDMTKKSRQKLKYLENEKSSCGEIKRILHNFKRAFVSDLKVHLRFFPILSKEPSFLASPRSTFYLNLSAIFFFCQSSVHSSKTAAFYNFKLKKWFLCNFSNIQFFLAIYHCCKNMYHTFSKKEIIQKQKTF